MTLNEWLTLAAIVLGPVIAVVITLLTEEARRSKERRLQLVHMLLSTRHLPADSRYNVAINLIPAEFNKDKEVMGAWRNYHACVREQHDGPAKQDHQRRMSVVQSALIYQVMRSIGLKLSEGDIQTEVYVSQGFIERDNLYLRSLQALPELAAAMKEQVEHTRTLIAALPPRGNAAPPR